jgi:hypothetical protein
MTLRVCLLAAAGALAFTASAAAQVPQRWTDSSGLYSLDVGSAGWGYSEGIQPTADISMMFLPAAEPAKGETRICLARWKLLLDTPLPSSDDVRRRASKIDLAEAGKILAQFGQTPSSVAHRDVDGVVVADIESSSARGPNRSLVFFTLDRGQLIRTTIQCMWDKGLPAARMAEINTLLTSLRIRNVDAKP